MEKFTPIVITSKKASDHFNNIKSQHSDIVRGIQDQATRVMNLNTEKENKKQVETESNRNYQMESDKIRNESDSKKMELENNRRELDIKSQALTI